MLCILLNAWTRLTRIPSSVCEVQCLATQGVFTELIQQFGVNDVQVRLVPCTATRYTRWKDTSFTTFEAFQLQVEELYSLEEEALQDLRCVAVFALNSPCTSDRQGHPQG
jgi:hypothetical protein